MTAPALFSLENQRRSRPLDVVSWGAGVESSACLTEILTNATRHDVDPENLIVLHAVVGSEFTDTLTLSHIGSFCRCWPPAVSGWYSSPVAADYTKAIAGLPANAVGELDDAIRHGRITPRTTARCLRPAWTRADLDGRAHPDIADIWLTLSHRGGMLNLLRNPAPR